jgi:uncharacterized RDD family membrane protein YckC
MAQTSIITGQYVRIQQTAATVFQRLLAWVVDGIVISLTTLILASAANSLSPILSSDAEEFIAVCIVLVELLYPFYMETLNNGRSVGKMLMGIRVVCLDGTKPSLSAFFIRWVTLPIDMFLGLAFIIFTKNSQRIGDLGAGTAVVRRSSGKEPEMLKSLYYVSHNYRPTYPEANTLSMRQAATIEKVLFMERGLRRDAYMFRLASKLSAMLGLPMIADNERFLSTLYKDFQYYATKVV